MSLQTARKTSPAMRGTIEKLITISRENNSVFWRDIAERLNAGSRRYSSINVGKISRLASDGETVVVAGSVLGSGFVVNPDGYIVTNRSADASTSPR